MYIPCAGVIAEILLFLYFLEAALCLFFNVFPLNYFPVLSHSLQPPTQQFPHCFVMSMLCDYDCLFNSL